MSGLESNFYAAWRLRCGVVPLFREDQETPPERLLQAVWFHQRLCRDQLTTLDGRQLQVLHPGFLNREAGPDFRAAVLQFENEPPCSGDVEVDLHSSGWTAHHHDKNPAFGKVALHVVWEGKDSGPLPTLSLKTCLDTTIGELSYWLTSEASQPFPSALVGQCAAPLRELTEDRVTELLHQAALVRLQSKAARFAARARQAGWDQALWEGLFHALGYKNNSWPMQRLAELRDQLVSTENRPRSDTLAGPIAGSWRPAPRGTDRQPTRFHLRPPTLGCLVAGARRLFPPDPAQIGVAFQWLASGQSPAAPSGPGRPLVERQHASRPIGEMGFDRPEGFGTGTLVAGGVSSGFGRVLVPSLDAAFALPAQGATHARRHARHRPGLERRPALVVEPRQ